MAWIYHLQGSNIMAEITVDPKLEVQNPLPLKVMVITLQAVKEVRQA